MKIAVQKNTLDGQIWYGSLDPVKNGVYAESQKSGKTETRKKTSEKVSEAVTLIKMRSFLIYTYQQHTLLL